MTTKRNASPAARRFWSKLVSWYGTRVLDSFGKDPDAEWCEKIDAATDTEVDLAWSLMRTRHVSHPPSLPEFIALLEEVRKPQTPRRFMASRFEQLAEWVLANRPLSHAQMRGWTYLHGYSANGVEVLTGVMIPADGDTPGFVVKLEEIAE